jgi:hypothetical protein
MGTPVSDEGSQARRIDLFKMMDQSPPIGRALRGYVRDAKLFKEHRGAGLL